MYLKARSLAAFQIVGFRYHVASNVYLILLAPQIFEWDLTGAPRLGITFVLWKRPLHSSWLATNPVDGGNYSLEAHYFSIVFQYIHTEHEGPVTRTNLASNAILYSVGTFRLIHLFS
jgi:hypothetical protein